MASIEPWEFNLSEFEKNCNYIKMTVEGESIFHYASTASDTDQKMSSASKEIDRLISTGWEQFYKEEQYSSLGSRYFLGFRKRKTIEVKRNITKGKEGNPKVFISYASEDYVKVQEIYKQFKNVGLDTWLDKENLLPGQRWDVEIQKNIEKADFVLLFFSTNSVGKRGYVQKEFKLALQTLEMIPSDEIFIIPIRLDDCEIPREFRHLQYIDYYQEHGFEKILRSLGFTANEAVSDYSPTVRLRSIPSDHITEDDLRQVLREKDFFDVKRYPKGNGVKNEFVSIYDTDTKARTVHDYATGLTWANNAIIKIGKPKSIEEHLRELNQGVLGYGGFRDWRLPTLEEGLSLLKARKLDTNLFSEFPDEAEKHFTSLLLHGNDRRAAKDISTGMLDDDLIDHFHFGDVSWMWTADKNGSGSTWIIGFTRGHCDTYGSSGGIGYYMIPVRNGKLSKIKRL